MKSMRKLTIKNLLMNKTRTLVTMIGILLSAALVTLVACMALSVQHTAINYYSQIAGNYTAAFYGDFTNSDLSNYQKNPDIQNVYGAMSVGLAPNEYPKYESVPYIHIMGLSEGALENCFNATLKEGRYPKNTSEVVLSKKFVKSTTKEYHVGDTITLDVGYREYTDTYSGDVVRISNSMSADVDDYQFRTQFQKTYTIVGILDNVADGIDSDYYSSFEYIYTGFDINHAEMVPDYDMQYLSFMYMQFTPMAEQHYAGTVANILGTDDTALVSSYLNGTGMGLSDSMQEVLSKNRMLGVAVNDGVLRAKLIKISLEDGFMVAVSLVVIFSIIIISSIFIIRNSFYISISEKAKLYGMLSSVGATPRQIRNNVFFEGFVIGVISIPIGIILGIIATAGLVEMCNVTLGDMLGGIRIQFAVAWQPIAMALVLCAGTIFMSVLSPAIETARISPIEAIRGNQEVNISKRKRRKPKSYKTPKIISKLCGIGGSIAWKNLKRSKSKYRATVISITASVAVYLAVSTVIGCLVSYVENSYQGMSYNMIAYPGDDFSTAKDVKKNFEKFQQFADRDEIEKSALGVRADFVVLLDLPSEKLSDTILESRNEYDDDSAMTVSLLVLDDSTYQKFAKAVGYTPQKGKYMFLDRVKNKIAKYDEDGNYAGSEEVYQSNFKDMEGYTVKFIDSDAYAYDERKEQAENFEEEWGYLYEDDYMEKYGSPTELTIGVVINPENGDFVEEYRQIANIDLLTSIIVDEEWFAENTEHLAQHYFLEEYYLYSSDDAKTEDALNEMGFTETSIYNLSKMVATINAISFVMQFFVYSFIGMISLIGLTNVFNTINTNMNLRKKEFAALRSIGMTNREFDNMITLESFFYTFKPLIIGIPIGLVLGFLGYNMLNRMSYDTIDYTFPTIPLLLSVGVVALLVWVIMSVSIRKVRNQNIIETIRNDNI